MHSNLSNSSSKRPLKEEVPKGSEPEHVLPNPVTRISSGSKKISKEKHEILNPKRELSQHVHTDLQPILAELRHQNVQHQELIQPVQPQELIQPVQEQELVQPQSQELVQPVQEQELIQPVQPQPQELVQPVQPQELVQPVQQELPVQQPLVQQQNVNMMDVENIGVGEMMVIDYDARDIEERGQVQETTVDIDLSQVKFKVDSTRTKYIRWEKFMIFRRMMRNWIEKRVLDKIKEIERSMVFKSKSSSYQKNDLFMFYNNTEVEMIDANVKIYHKFEPCISMSSSEGYDKAISITCDLLKLGVRQFDCAEIVCYFLSRNSAKIIDLKICPNCKEIIPKIGVYGNCKCHFDK